MQLADGNELLDSGWNVIQTTDFVPSAKQFLKNFVELKADAGPLFGLPDPTKLCGLFLHIPFL